MKLRSTKQSKKLSTNRRNDFKFQISFCKFTNVLHLNEYLYEHSKIVFFYLYSILYLIIYHSNNLINNNEIIFNYKLRANVYIKIIQ